MEIDKYIVIDGWIGNTKVTIRVDLDDNFKSQINSLKNYEVNSGYINIKSVYTYNKEYCFWDSLPFFLMSSKERIKKECKQELINKKLYEKGIFKLIQEMLDILVEKGYLTRDI